jgi:hypothetical protein
MLARAIPVILALALLSGCVDSERLRHDFGGPPADTYSQPSK